MTADPRFKAFGYDLEILDGNRSFYIRDDYRRLVDSVEVHQIWDGADELSITLRAWDERSADFVVVGQKILAPGRNIILRMGYGGRRYAVGKFTVVEHQPQLGPKPAIRVVAYDGLAKLQDRHWPGYYGTPATYTDLVVKIAAQYGFGLIADASRPIPHRVKRRRKRGKGRGITSGTVTTVFAKKAGDSDLKMLKLVADAAGFLWPKVRWIDAGSREYSMLQGTELAQSKSTASMWPVVRIDGGASSRGREVLVFERANRRRQSFGQTELLFELRRIGGDDTGTLTQFNPRLVTQNVPQSVRVTGITPDGKRLMRVTAEFVDAELIREGLTGRVAVTEQHERVLTKQDRKKFQRQEVALLEILGEKDRVVERDFRTGKTVQTLGAQVLRQMPVVRDAADLRGIARGWLLARIGSMQTADSEARDTPGLETLYPNQFHSIGGVPEEYIGLWMVREVTHRLQRTNHVVSTQWQRIGEIPAQTRETAVEITGDLT